MREVKLHGARAAGRMALVDDQDYELVAAYRWFVHEVKVAGRRNHGPYAYANAYRNGRRTRIYMHALIVGFPGADHENHNTLDNRRGNLRQATGSQNQGNCRSHIAGSSRHKGVHWDRKRSKWRAEIRVGGRYRHLGRFVDEDAAARAYDAAALAEWGEFAALNFPETTKAA